MLRLKKVIDDETKVLAGEPLDIDADLLARGCEQTEALQTAQVTAPDIGDPWLTAAFDPAVQDRPTDERGAAIARKAEAIYATSEKRLDDLRATRDRVEKMAENAQTRVRLAERFTETLEQHLGTFGGARRTSPPAAN